VTASINGQALTKLSIKTGPTFCGQQKTPSQYAEGGMTNGYSGTIEPTWLTFGTKKQIDINSDFSFIRKGGTNMSRIYTYDQFGQLAGSGSETYKVALDYFSFSPNLKWNFSKLFFIKAGPRIDVLLNYDTRDRFSSDGRTRNDFESLNYGLSYGFGMSAGKKRTKFILEVLGQHDFSAASYHPSTGQTFTNYCFLLNVGVTVGLHTAE
jgi:hypothetical protein